MPNELTCVHGGIKIAKSSADRIGSAMGGKEKALSFEPKYWNTGFVEYISGRQGTFHLKHSIVPTPTDQYHNQTIYVCDNVKRPNEGDLIEVSVRETAKDYKPIGKSDRGPFKTIYYIFVKEWRPVDPHTIRGAKNFSREQFLDFLNLPFYGDYGTTGIAESMGLYIVACPPPSDYTQGGINTLIQSKYFDTEKIGAVGKLMGVMPPEFLKRQYRNFYKLLESPTMIYSPDSREVSLSWFNVPAIPPHIPITINCDIKGFNQYKEKYNDDLWRAQSFMIDSLFYQPKITDRYLKRFEDALHEMRQAAWTAAEQGQFSFDLDGTTRLALAFARLFAQSEMDTKAIKKTVETYEDSLNESKKSARAAVNMKGNPNLKEFYKRSPEEKIVLLDIQSLKDTGQELTITNLNKICKIKGERLQETLNKLSKDGFIYFPGGDRIGLLK